MSEGLDPILQQKEQQQLKTQLLWRLGIAGGLITAILFGIGWIEKSQENAAPNVQIPQIAPELNASEPEAIASAASEAATAAPSPTASASPKPTDSPKPSAISATTAPPHTTTNPASKQVNSSPIQKIENAPKNIPQTSKQPEITPRALATAIPLNNKPSPTLNSKSVTSETPTNTNSRPLVADYPAPLNSARGYSVQAGVFLLSNNAEKLLSQLQQAGIPAYLETRVQIGPFKSKAEADAAVKKLKALGITPVVKTE
ncbi:SPOR domain-containing protein [Chitinibacter fontanus]|uniref:SPOR domain-containing protein n=1 Tax=Chitinibacter fontanus TaxID=1737446 RepID=A0A7D5VC99_9NEIS|nr:SPOR domain-containing protein [Chitinibacter fontanus]QLI82780.1 SPOR domain-containing protein [Chitinibacter fontanus]